MGMEMGPNVVEWRMGKKDFFGEGKLGEGSEVNG
jgi:hypothetical protein